MIIRKTRTRCRSCGDKSFFYPEFRVRHINGRDVKEVFFKCPKCLSSGWVRYKNPRRHDG